MFLFPKKAKEISHLGDRWIEDRMALTGATTPTTLPTMLIKTMGGAMPTERADEQQPETTLCVGQTAGVSPRMKTKHVEVLVQRKKVGLLE